MIKKYQNNFYLFIIHVLIQKEHNRQQADDWLWDTIPNNLPLGLKPIGAVSNTHLRLVVVELLHRNGFSEWVGQVLLSVDLLKVNVTSIHYLPDEMVAVQNMLRPLVCFRFLCLSNGSRAVTIEQNWTSKGGCYSELGDEFPQPQSLLWQHLMQRHTLPRKLNQPQCAAWNSSSRQPHH